MTDLRAVLTSIRDANYHRGGLRCRWLFDAEPATLAGLIRDAERMRAEQSPSLPGAAGHVTRWTDPSGRVEQFSLLTASGRYDDFRHDHDLSTFGKRFRDAARYPAFNSLVAALPDLVNMRLNVLGPGAALAPHEEHSVVRSRTGRVGVRARFHLPLVTDEHATLLLDGDVFHLAAGTVHLVNHGCVHAARNAGPADRVHLVWDMLLTEEATGLMFGDGPPLAGFTRITWPGPEPVGRREVPDWRRIAAPVPEREAHDVRFLDVQ
ncbi:aspartyl/asparaginyl beta-hydroxylase domain-containing protein [Micromonospora sp. DR5-3]|uniref:aspartyl/asparaginyl beta-hydroxylase domain-containing protein n=1 Tax=unclassified Micromonospora TaxID=2617518 RepID=UPI0011D504D9|nr:MULTISPECIES: aspartyl/asparaginyl beta-hydroxylase domain-containing protein [unclassified Micromonospora]MCW3818991.1 aspartyl/asparaginyl beta-hydroxylase domain-containing protein [Micromonospora sp. DR5-3]TYC21004.1 aspartyl/asparaginyl beta-hydroxylase domain-containing protein [Micromonospora sp. MP36]